MIWIIGIVMFLFGTLIGGTIERYRIMDTLIEKGEFDITGTGKKIYLVDERKKK